MNDDESNEEHSEGSENSENSEGEESGTILKLEGLRPLLSNSNIVRR